MARPSSFTEDIAEAICDRVVMRSLHAVSQDDDMPDESTIYRWLRDNAEFYKNYMRAREIRAYRRAEGADQIVADMRAKTIDANQARVELDALKWQTARENSKGFSDRQVLAGDPEAPLSGLSDEALDQRLNAALAKALSDG